MKRSMSECSSDFADSADSISMNTSQVPFHLKDPSRQKRIFRDMTMELDNLFSKYNISKKADCQSFLNYCLNNQGPTKLEEDINVALTKQMASLSLPARNELIRSLTHQKTEDGSLIVNEDLVGLFPVLEKRSRQLLLKTERATRKDKIDLQFVSDFMHDYCRYTLLL